MRMAARLLPPSLLRTPPISGEAHVWLLSPHDVADPSLLSRYHSLLSPQEKQHVAAAAANERLTRVRLMTRALVRVTLARYCNNDVDPSSILFSLNKWGKPEISWQDSPLDPSATSCLPSLSFNLSHSPSLIACAVTLNTPVGIDVEDASRVTRLNAVSLARKQFTEEEAHWVETGRSSCTTPDDFASDSPSASDSNSAVHRNDDDDDDAWREPRARSMSAEGQMKRFLRLWTLKEAYVKATGRGMAAMPFKAFSINLSQDPRICHSLLESTQLPCIEKPDLITLTHRKKVQPQQQLLGRDSRTLLEPHDDAFSPCSCWPQLLSLNFSESHVGGLCLLHQDENGCVPLRRVRVLRTIPLVSDEDAKGVLTTGMSLSASLRTTEALYNDHHH